MKIKANNLINARRPNLSSIKIRVTIQKLGASKHSKLFIHDTLHFFYLI